MTLDHLEIAANHEVADKTLELSMTFVIGGFSGSGEAHFDAAALSATIARMDVFPIPDGQTLSIAGGYWDAERAHIREPHLSIQISSARRGLVWLTASVARPWDDPGMGGVQSSATATCLIDFETLSKLRRGLAALTAADKETVRVDIPTGI